MGINHLLACADGYGIWIIWNYDYSLVFGGRSLHSMWLDVCGKWLENHDKNPASMGKAQLHVCSTMFYLSFFFVGAGQLFDSCEVLRALSHYLGEHHCHMGHMNHVRILGCTIQVSNTWESHKESMCDILCLDGFHMISPNTLWQHGKGKIHHVGPWFSNVLQASMGCATAVECPSHLLGQAFCSSC